MRTRWDEEDEVSAGSRGKFSMIPLAMGMAVPVAFIAGAAIMNYYDLSRTPPAAPAQPSVASGNTVSKTDSDAKLAAERAKSADAVKKAQAEVASLRAQVEKLQEQAEVSAREQQTAQRAFNERIANAEQRVSQAVQDKAEAEAKAEADAKVAAAAQQVDTAETVAALSTPADLMQRKVSELARQPDANLIEAEGNTAPTNDTAARATSVAASPYVDSAHTDNQPTIQNVAAGPTSVSAGGNAGSVVTTGGGAATKQGRPGRNAETVEVAMQNATGLDDISPGERDGLKRQLTAGECVATSLEDLFGSPVPVVPLRNLVRDLNSDC